MLIKTQLRLVALLPAVFALLIGSVLWGSQIKIDQARTDAEIAEKILLSNFELNILTQEYLLYGGKRVESQLLIRQQSMGELLAQLKYEEIEEQDMIDALRHSHQELGDLYATLLGGKATVREQIAGALLVKAQDTRSKARRFADIQYRQVVEFQRREDNIIMAAIAALAVLSMIMLALLAQRLNRGIGQLDSGVRQITGGNLDHQIQLATADELGALANAFNNMGRKLRDSYTSIDKLEDEIAGRKQAEESLRNSETRLHTIIENLAEGLAVSALDGQLLYFNRAALDMHGFTTLDECRQHLSKFADTFELSALEIGRASCRERV